MTGLFDQSEGSGSTADGPSGGGDLARERALARRLDVSSRELDALRAERDRLGLELDNLRLATIGYQRELHESDTRSRAALARLDRGEQTLLALLARHRRLRIERDAARWRSNDFELSLAEVRELFSEQRSIVDELTSEIRLALEDLRRAEASPGARVGQALGRAARAQKRDRRPQEPEALYAALARLEDIDRKLSHRVRPVLRGRPSRIGRGRRRVTLLCWEMGHNPLGRAHMLAEVLRRSHDVEIAGPLFPRYGSKVWEPVRGSDIPMWTFPGPELPEFVQATDEFVRSLRTEIVVACKPRFPSLLMAMLAKHERGVPVVFDVDDRELSFFGATDGISLAELEQRRARPDFRLPFGESWTLASDSLVGDADAVTVSSEALQRLYSGRIVPHARDERMLDPARYDRAEIRAEVGYGPEDKVVLFVGTPRLHKGLVELTDAIAEIDDPSVKLCIVGPVTDPGMRLAFSRLRESQLKILDSRPLSDIARTTLIGDLICLLQRPDDEVTRYQTPAKLTDALAMGVPVLARATMPLEPFARAGLIELVGERPLSSRIAELLAEPERTRDRVEAGREYFRSHLSYEAAASTLDQVFADVASAPSQPPASWRSALEIARATESERPTESRPARRPLMYGSTRHTWDIVFFWKQNDSWIYGRRSDMLMKHLARSDRTRKVIHFDAPMSWDDLDAYRRRRRGVTADQAAEIYRRLRWRMLVPQRHGKLRSYTFVARREDEPSGWQRALLPSQDEYLGYIEHVLHKSRVGKRAPVLFWVWPVNFQFPEIHAAFEPSLTVADVVDDHRGWVAPGSGYYAQLTENYEQVLALSDVVFANCEPVGERMKWFGSSPLVIPNAMELSSRRPHSSRRPRELRELSGPLIGYVGNLGARIDLPLLQELARQRPDCQIVLIGSAHLSNEILELDREPNVHFLGVRPYPDVLRYVRSFDVAIIPHRDDELTRSMNPLKAFVYAGCGIPVVTTEIANLPELDGAIRSAPTHDEFIRAVSEVIEQVRSGELPAPDRTVLERHTWDQRVTQIERVLDGAGETLVPERPAA
jgi:glycosyltransferase involved in cell wall biosynthesis